MHKALRPELGVDVVAKVGEGSLRTTRPLLNHAEAVRHLNEQLTISASLRRRHDHIARQVVRRLIENLLLREVAHKMEAVIALLAEHVEKEGADGLVHTLAVQEHARNVAEVLAVNVLLQAIHLEERDSVIAINLVTRWVPYCASLRVPRELTLVWEEAEAEVTNVEALAVVLVGQRRKVPHFHIALTQLDLLDVLDQCALLEHLPYSLFVELGRFIWISQVRLICQSLLLFDFVLVFELADQSLVHLDAVVRNPLVERMVLADEMHVVLVAAAVADFFE